MNAAAADRLIVALDVDSVLEAQRIVGELAGVVTTFKIGPKLLTQDGGYAFAQALAHHREVFLDLKLFDIPSVVEEAVSNIARVGFAFVTVHAMRQVMQAAAAGVAGWGSNLKVLGVTVLTSMTDQDLAQDHWGASTSVEQLVRTRVANAVEDGVAGIVCSAQELKAVQEVEASFNAGRLLRVVPGVRLDQELQDQKRTAGPAAAIEAGADYLVVGRAVVAAPKPLEVVKTFITEIERGLEKRG